MRRGDAKIKSNYGHCKRDLGVHQSQLVEEISFSSFPATTSAQEAQEKVWIVRNPTGEPGLTCTKGKENVESETEAFSFNIVVNIT